MSNLHYLPWPVDRPVLHRLIGVDAYYTRLHRLSPHHALATFVTLVGARFWVVIAYVTHQLRASDADTDGLHYQQQLIYRNASHLSAAWLILRLAWSWRGRVPASSLLGRTAAFALLPLLSFVAFTAASVLTARVTRSSRVSITPWNCGFLRWSQGAATVEGKRVYDDWTSRAALKAQNYARSCYGDQDTAIASCEVFPVQTLPCQSSAGVLCPFQDGRCLANANGDLTYEMITPWLNSHDHFGLNVPKADRVECRRMATCAVLNISDMMHTIQRKTDTEYYYYLGPTSPSSPVTLELSDNTQNGGCGYSLKYVIERRSFKPLQFHEIVLGFRG